MPIKYKARIVCRGDMDPGLLSLRRDAPTLARLSLMVFADCHIADITGAFLQGDQSLASRKEPLYLRQPREGLPGLFRDQLLLVVRGIFGLANSPRLFWRHLRDTLLQLGAVHFGQGFVFLLPGQQADPGSWRTRRRFDRHRGGEAWRSGQGPQEANRDIFDFGTWADDGEDKILEYGGKQITRQNGVIKLPRRSSYSLGSQSR